MSRRVKGSSRAVKGFSSATNPRKVKTIDEMNVAELRVLASRYGIKSGGKKKPKLKQDIKAKMKEVKLSDTAYLVNTETGSITSASFPEEKFNVSVIDKDVEPHRTAKVERLGEGMYNIEQETVLGEQENVVVTVSDTSPYPDTSLIKDQIKSGSQQGTSPSQIQSKKELEKFLNELSYSELRDIVSANNLGWKRDRYSKRGAIKGGTKGGRPSKAEYIQSILKVDSDGLIIPKEIEKEHISLSSTVSIPYSPDLLRNIPQVEIKNNRLIPVQPYDYPKTWKIQKIRKEEQKRKEYEAVNLAPFYNVKKVRQSSNEVYDLDDLLVKTETKDIAVEKPQLLTKEEKKKYKVIGSFGGQNIQAKSDGQIFRGFYFQDAKKDEIKHFFKADIIKVDPDDTGHYLALMNELYSGHKAKSVYFGNEIGSINYLRANKFMGKQILSSVAYQRNKAISDSLKASLSEVPIREDLEDTRGVFSPLAYRNSAGQVKDLSVSEEQIAIANAVQDIEVQINVKLVDSDHVFSFDYKEEDLDQTVKPILKFEVIGGEVKPLDSDTLLQYAVNSMQLEPDAVQNMLEALYQQGWINYPRADTIKAEDEPIFLLRDIKDFRGTEYERKLLVIIDSADKSYKANKPFIQHGEWVLKQGQSELRASSLKLANEPSFYSDEGFDITLERGLSPSALTDFLITNDITTPATRTAIISAMKEAGILSLDKNRKYQLDRRGLYFASAYQFFEENGIELSIDLKKKINDVQTIQEIAEIVNSYDIVNRKDLKGFIKIKAEDMLEQQTDLTILEAY